MNLQGWPRRLLEANAQLVGDDGSEGGLAQPRRSEEEDVVESFAARPCGFEGDGELLFGFGLTDELGEPGGAELQLKGGVVVDAGGGYKALGFGGRFRIIGNGH